MLELLIAGHCAPALAGIKPANIASLNKADIPDIHSEIKKLNNQLNICGIYIEILCECDLRAIVIVYRKNVLKNHIAKRECRDFLERYGYSNTEKLEDYFSILKKRLKECAFPHEIGVFLGYPIRDIYGFINHRDEGCLLVGDWRVYHNAEEAEKIFGRYRACKRALAQKVAQGRKLAQIFCAA